MANRNKKLHYVAGCFRQTVSIKSLFLIMGVSMCICLDTWNQIPFLWSEQSTITAYYYLFNSITYGGTYMPYLMPVFAACAYAVSYVKETSGGMKPYLVGRIGYGGYAAGKIVVSTVSGGLTAAMGIIVFCVVVGYFKPLYEWEEGVNALYYSQPDSAHGIIYIGILIYLTMLSGMLWSMVSLFCSSYFENIYIAIASPLLCSYLLTRIYVYLDIPNAYRLDYWLSGRDGVGSDKELLIWTTCRVLLIIMIMAFLFYRRIKKRESGGEHV